MSLRDQNRSLDEATGGSQAASTFVECLFKVVTWRVYWCRVFFSRNSFAANTSVGCGGWAVFSLKGTQLWGCTALGPFGTIVFCAGTQRSGSKWKQVTIILFEALHFGAAHLLCILWKTYITLQSMPMHGKMNTNTWLPLNTKHDPKHISLDENTCAFF